MDKYIVHMINTKENSRKIGEIIEQIKLKNPSHSDKIVSLLFTIPVIRVLECLELGKNPNVTLTASLKGAHRVLYSFTLYFPRE